VFLLKTFYNITAIAQVSNFSKSKKVKIFFTIVATISLFDLAIFFYLPLLSNVRQEFNVSESLVQMTVSLNMLGIGGSSLVYGMLSDTRGRKKIVLFGIFVFAVASFFISQSESIYAFIIFRIFQGIGGGVSWSVGMAILHDIYTGKSFAKAMLALQTVMGMMFIVSPALGGYIGGIIYWRGSFNLMAALGIILFVYSVFFLPETLQHTKSKVKIKNILSNYKALFTNGSYVKYLIIKVLLVSAAMINVTNMPLIFVETYNTSTNFCGILLGCGGTMFLIGAGISSKLLDYISARDIIKYALLLILMSDILMIIAQWLDFLTAIRIQVIKSPCLLGIAAIMGNASHKAISAIPKLSGSASSIMVAMELLIGAVLLEIVSMFYNGTIYPIEIFTLAAVGISYCALKINSNSSDFERLNGI
jgi:DHA1 family bicyclomycin/chloramphenicol resistance-like MFS transporter